MEVFVALNVYGVNQFVVGALSTRANLNTNFKNSFTCLGFEKYKSVSALKNNEPEIKDKRWSELINKILQFSF